MLSSIFPSDMPFALMEYAAPHPDTPSSLLFVLMPISRTTQYALLFRPSHTLFRASHTHVTVSHTRNILASKGHRASYTVTNRDGRANQERVSLLGVSPSHPILLYGVKILI
jgi:hypothetical protein